jgi:hypothetical protein
VRKPLGPCLVQADPVENLPDGASQVFPWQPNSRIEMSIGGDADVHSDRGHVLLLAVRRRKIPIHHVGMKWRSNVCLLPSAAAAFCRQTSARHRQQEDPLVLSLESCHLAKPLWELSGIETLIGRLGPPHRSSNPRSISPPGSLFSKHGERVGTCYGCQHPASASTTTVGQWRVQAGTLGTDNGPNIIG